MRFGILQLICAVVLMTAAPAQQSHWATPDDKTAKYMIDMERKWAEVVCTNNGVIAELLAEDFQGTSTNGERYNKADELRDEKGPHSAHGRALDDAKVRFFGEDVAIIYGSEHAIGKDKTHPEGEAVPGVDRYLVEAGWQVADHCSAGQQGALQVDSCTLRLAQKKGEPGAPGTVVPCHGV